MTGYNRRAETGGALLGGQPVNGNSDVATFEFATKAGFTAASIGIRRVILGAGSKIDTILSSPSPPVLQINGGGTGTQPPTQQLPTINLSATSLKMDDTSVGVSSQKTFTISNSGSASLSVIGITVSETDAAQFKVSPTTATIAPGANQTITVTFAPTSKGSKSASLSIAHNATGSPSAMALTGTGVSPSGPAISLSATSLKMDDTNVGASSQKTFTISYSGNASLSVTGITISGMDAAQFKVSPTSATIAAGGSQTITVTFTPSSAGSKSASLSVAHNAAGSPSAVALTGTGVSASPPPQQPPPTQPPGPGPSVPNAAPGSIYTIAGGGVLGSGYIGDGDQATRAILEPSGVAVDGSGNIYIADVRNGRARKVNLSGIISTVAGTHLSNTAAPGQGDGGPATEATLQGPGGVFIDGTGNLYAVEAYRIRKVDPSGVISTVAGSSPFGPLGDGGSATQAKLQPSDVFVDRLGNLYIAERGEHRVRRVEAKTGILTVVAGGSVGDNGPAMRAPLNQPSGIFADRSGNLYIADKRNNRVRKVDPSGTITTVAGNGNNAGSSGDGGQAVNASLSYPSDVFKDASGNLYIAEWGNSRVRKVDPSGVISTVAGGGFTSLGDGGPATQERLNQPSGIFVDGSGNLYIADTQNHRVRKVDSSGTIFTVAGNGTPGFSGDGGLAFTASLNAPSDVWTDRSGNLYIADEGNLRVRKVDPSGIISTVAGNGYRGTYSGNAFTGGFLLAGDDGPATSANLAAPCAGFVDDAGNLYIVDRGHCQIRKVDARSGLITTVAGYGFLAYSGEGVLATLSNLESPAGVCTDFAGNLYISEQTGHRIRMVSALPAAGSGTPGAGSGTPGAGVGPVAPGAPGAGRQTLVPAAVLIAGGDPKDGGAATEASLSQPSDAFLDGAGNLYIADELNARIRRVDAKSGVITTVAGDGFPGYSGDGGPAVKASIGRPSDIYIDGGGNLYIADRLNNRVRKVDSSGIITTVAGGENIGSLENAMRGGNQKGDGGPATEAVLSAPVSVFVDGPGNLYIAESGEVRKVDAKTGIISTVAGNGTYQFSGDGGPAIQAGVGPLDVWVDGSGNLYIADAGNWRVRRVDGRTGIITTVAGNGNGGFSGDGGPATSASLAFPLRVIGDNAGNLYVLDSYNSCIRRVDASGTITTVSRAFLASVLSRDGLGNFYVGDDRQVYKVTSSASVTAVAGRKDIGDNGPAVSANVIDPRGIFMDKAGNLYVADRGNRRVRKVDTAGTITTVAGGGGAGDGYPATQAGLSEPVDVFVDKGGNLFVADVGLNRVWKVDAKTGVITTVAGGSADAPLGDGGPANKTRLGGPYGIFVDGLGNLYIAERSQRVRKVDANTGFITTVAGDGNFGFSGDGGLATRANLSNPSAVFVDAAGNLYIADADNGRIRKVDAKTGIITTVAGSLNNSFALDARDGVATEARLDHPSDLFVDSRGNIFIADTGENRIRMVDPSGTIVTLAGPPATFRRSGSANDVSGGLAGAGSMVVDLPSPQSVFVDSSGNLYVSSNHRVLKILNPSLTIELAVSSSTVRPDGADASTIRARLLSPDRSLRRDDNATVVRFRITDGAGSLSAGDVKVSGGVATTTLTGRTPGPVVVQAGAPGAETAPTSIVVSGEYYLFPYNLHLTAGATSAVPLEVRDQNGNKISSPVTFYGFDVELNQIGRWEKMTDPLISVSPDGFVKALREERIRDTGKQIYARINGQETVNRVVVRVLSKDYGVPFAEKGGEHMTLYYPTRIEGEDMAQYVTRYQIPTVNEYAYAIQSGLTGIRPFNGYKVILETDFGEVSSADLNPEAIIQESDKGKPGAITFGGYSGNPVRISYNIRDNYGVFMGPRDASQRIGITVTMPRLPGWFVYYHELGHNFSTPSPTFSSLFYAFAETEDFADMLSIETMERILKDPGQFPISEDARASLQSQMDGIVNYYPSFFQTWLDKGADFSVIPDIKRGYEGAIILDGIYLRYKKLRGNDFADRFFSVLNPQYYPRLYSIGLKVSGQELVHTVFAALISAAMEQDLSKEFINTYHFPINQSLFDQAYRTLLSVMVSRTIVPPPVIPVSSAPTSDFDGDGSVGFGDFFLLAGAFGSPATGDNAKFDLDGDGSIGFGDFFLLAGAFGT